MRNSENEASELSTLVPVSSITIAILSSYLGSIFLLDRSFFGFQNSTKW